MGHVERTYGAGGKGTRYGLTDGLFRVWYQYRKGMGRLEPLIRFMAFWYEPDALKGTMDRLPAMVTAPGVVPPRPELGRDGVAAGGGGAAARHVGGGAARARGDLGGKRPTEGRCQEEEALGGDLEKGEARPRGSQYRLQDANDHTAAIPAFQKSLALWKIWQCSDPR